MIHFYEAEGLYPAYYEYRIGKIAIYFLFW